MRSLVRAIPVVAIALMIFSLPVLADKGTMVQYGESGSGVQVERIEITNNSEFICFPFLCN